MKEAAPFDGTPAAEEKKPKSQHYVKDHAIQRMIEHYERQDVKLINRLEKIRLAIMSGRSEVRQLTELLKQRQQAREKYYAGNESV